MRPSNATPSATRNPASLSASSLSVSPRRRVALTPSPPRPLTPSSLRRKLTVHSSHGFSLVELMIAIMILGLGMVMAATIFPVSLDMTRGTVQLNLSETAADAAAATLALRVPRYSDLDGNSAIDFVNGFPINAIPRVSLPDMVGREFLGDQDPAYLDALDLNVQIPRNANTLIPDELPLVRIYTERSFWDAEYYPASLMLPSFVVAMQNLQPPAGGDPHKVYSEFPPVIPYISLTPSAPRISVADRVYPPVDLVRFDGTARPLVNPDPADLGILDEVAQRRYAWAAIHFRDVYDETQKSFFTRIVILYRANLSARYAAQHPDSVGTNTPLAADDGHNAGVKVLYDTLFPQPWLVLLDNVSPTGVISCTHAVAQLLPVGSYVITAVGNPPGAYTKVLKNDLSPYIAPAPQVKPGDLPVGNPILVWVFPPALESAQLTGRNATNTRFQPRSPVIDVVPKKVIAE